MSISKRGKKILVFTALVVAISAGVTISYFRDTEESKDNLFQAGSIDIKLANTSYYNGELVEGGSWQFAELDDQQGPLEGKYLFYNFNDLKPGDWGEGTLELKVVDNDSWLCADVTVTENVENGISGPERRLNDTEEIGELAREIKFVWWTDDGDNVLEDDEAVISQSTLADVPTGIPAPIVFADATNNLWNSQGGPLPGDSMKSIGSGWCYGDMTLAPRPQGENSPLGGVENSGFVCNGVNTGDISQSDRAKLDVLFYAFQARHNTQFVCPSLKYPLTVSMLGNGSGSVLSDIAGIDCGDDCWDEFYRTQVVTLTPTPDDNSNFIGWGGDCTGAGVCQITFDQARNVVANFVLKHTLSVTLTGDGIGTVSSTPAGISCGADCSEVYNHGTNITLLGAPIAGSILQGWTGCNSVSPDNLCLVTMDQAKNVTANFVIQKYSLTVSLSGLGSGRITTSPTGIDCTDGVSDCTENYLPNTNVALYTTVLGSGHLFGGWGGACSSYQYQDYCYVTMDSVKTVTAKFVRPFSGTMTATLNSTADTYVDDDFPANSYGTLTTFVSKMITGSGGNEIDGLVKFNLGGIPSNMTVVSATLRLYAENVPAGNRFTLVVPVTSVWTESSTWNTRPTYDYKTSVTNVSAIGFQYWDVTSQTRQFVAQPASNYGYMIMAGPSSTITFRSREYSGTSYDPQLVVTYADYR